MSYKQDIKIDFPPNFAVRWGHGKANACFVENIFIKNLKTQLHFATKINSYVPFFEKIDIEQISDIDLFWNQIWFPQLE